MVLCLSFPPQRREQHSLKWTLGCRGASVLGWAAARGEVQAHLIFHHSHLHLCHLHYSVGVQLGFFCPGPYRAAGIV